MTSTHANRAADRIGRLGGLVGTSVQLVAGRRTFEQEGFAGGDLDAIYRA
ncbi:hypothetical protein [Streptomyces celluloflavus]